MAEVREPANIKYAKQILALIEKEIIENRGDISSVEVKHRQLLEDKKRLREEQKKLLRTLAKQILALIEKEIIENRGNLMSTEVKHRQLLEEQKRLREEQKNLLRELGKLESEECCECPDSLKSISID